MPRFIARAEFRRRTRASPWVLAGVTLDGRFWPAAEGIEPIRQRLPDAGLVGWAEMPVPIIAPDVEAAVAVAIDVARATWPGRVRDAVPWASGTRDPA